MSEATLAPHASAGVFQTRTGDCFVAQDAPRNDTKDYVNHSLSLRRGAEFQTVWDKGKSWSHPLVVLRARANGMDRSRFGFVAGKKVGQAVRRNRAKRLLREVVRLRLPQIAQGWDVVLIARGGAEKAEYREVEKAVEQVLNRAKLLK